MLKRSLLANLVMGLAEACSIALIMIARGVPADLQPQGADFPVMFLALSLSAYLHFYIPLLFFSGLLAILLILTRCRSWRAAVANGAAFGLLVATFLIHVEFHGHWLVLPIGLVTSLPPNGTV